MCSRQQKLRAELLFSLHVSIVLALIVFAFFAPLGILLLVLILHRFLLVKFNGCIISKWERKARSNPNYDFFTEVTRRASGKKITSRGSENFDLILISAIVLIALFAHLRRRQARWFWQPRAFSFWFYRRSNFSFSCDFIDCFSFWETCENKKRSQLFQLWNAKMQTLDFSVEGLFPNHPNAREDPKCLAVADVMGEIGSHTDMTNVTQERIIQDSQKRLDFISAERRITLADADSIAFALYCKRVSIVTAKRYAGFRLLPEDLAKWEIKIV